MDAVTELSQIINGSDNIVFFGGAGVSTESGIPDFRGSGGLYTSHNDAAVSPETILTARYMTTHPAEFFRYYVSLRRTLMHCIKRPAASMCLNYTVLLRATTASAAEKASRLISY